MTESIYSDSDCAQFNQFVSTVWGDSGTVLKRSGDIEFIDLEPYPLLRQMFAGPVSHDKILVREEYRIAIQELETETYYHGAYVTGQPGIGKTLFLIYVLVIHLGQKRAVALQFPDGRPFYALFRHSVSFHSVHDSKPLDEIPYLWALSDSNKQAESPCGIFVGRPRSIRVIQATSPREIRWKEWSKQATAKGYVMDIWSEREILDLAWVTNALSLQVEFDDITSELQGLDTERMTLLAERWGCVPRVLLQLMDEDDSYTEKWYRGRALTAVRKCGDMMSAVSNNAPSQIFFCQPWIAEHGTIDRKHSRPTVPTRTIRRFLGEALRIQTNIIKMDFFNALRQSNDTSQAAGNIFENWFHSFFSAGNSIQCNWVQGRGDTSLTGVNNLAPAVWLALQAKQPPYLWIARGAFPGIDSVLVLKKKIYAFQVTISSTHKSPIEGMKIFRDHLPNDLKKVPWSVVFVGDSADLISNVAAEWVDNIYFPTRKVPIAWSEVDPVNPRVVYEEFN